MLGNGLVSVYSSCLWLVSTPCSSYYTFWKCPRMAPSLAVEVWPELLSSWDVSSVDSSSGLRNGGIGEDGKELGVSASVIRVTSVLFRRTWSPPTICKDSLDLNSESSRIELLPYFHTCWPCILRVVKSILMIPISIHLLIRLQKRHLGGTVSVRRPSDGWWAHPKTLDFGRHKHSVEFLEDGMG